MAHGQWTEIEARGVLEAWKRSGVGIEKFARSSFSLSAVVAAGVGRGIFGAASAGVSASGLVQTVGFQAGAGITSGMVGGAVSSAHLP